MVQIQRQRKQRLKSVGIPERNLSQESLERRAGLEESWKRNSEEKEDKHYC